MTALSFPIPAHRAQWLASLLARQPLLATFGLTLLLLAPMTLILQWADPRLLDGENVWVKPTKFLVSMSLFALTSAWLHGLVAEEKRNTVLLRWNARILVATAAFELVYIGWAASKGIHSHFNVVTPALTLMFNLMGIAALILVGTGLPLAWALARYPERDSPRVLIAAGAIGLVLTFALGATSGFAIGGAGGHDIGPRTASLPIFGWSLSGGDLRVSHFLGMHAQQVLPILGLILAAWRPRRAGLLLAAGAVVYTALTLGALAQARAGFPFTAIL